MSTQKSDQRPPVEAWLGESLRLTAFPTADAQVTAETWWKGLFGEEASTQTIQRTSFTRQEQGEWQGGLLSLTVHPARIDWVFSPKVPQDTPLSDFPSVGPLLESAPKFVELMLRWLPSGPALDRLALGLGAFLPVPDQAKGYGILATLLPSVKVDPESSDFRYQINRPRPSRRGAEGLQINRLAAWAVMRLELVSITGSAGARRAAGLYACRTDVDINTAPSPSQPLPQERLPDLLQEFLDIALQIVAEGDRS